MTTTSTARFDQAQALPRIVALLGGASLVGLGLWAMIGPRTFFDAIAEFPPYNQHLVQDIGAFQIGLGAVLVLAGLLPRADALAVGLLGVGAGAAAHVVSHLVGRDLGGRPGVDIPFFVTFAVLLLAAGLARWSELRT
ncbi:MAG: hypothetical protein H0U89_07695 [Acidimicrobiia bacterium]|nr:hypothetical protein [Acidimicrobiia bacterium]